MHRLYGNQTITEEHLDPQKVKVSIKVLAVMNMHVLRTLPFSMYMNKGFDIYQHKQLHRNRDHLKRYNNICTGTTQSLCRRHKGLRPVHIPEHSLSSC